MLITTSAGQVVLANVRNKEQNGKEIQVNRGEKEPAQKSRKSHSKGQKRLSPKNRSK